ncbi:hypothetical protein ACWOYR_001203 [Vibrio parahaemolyticus]
MSKIIAALEGNASLEIDRLITEAINLKLICPNGEFSSEDVKLAITHLTKSIASRADALNTLYYLY